MSQYSTLYFIVLSFFRVVYSINRTKIHREVKVKPIPRRGSRFQVFLGYGTGIPALF